MSLRVRCRGISLPAFARPLALAVAVLALISPMNAALASALAFPDWVSQFRVDAAARGIDPLVFDAAFATVEPIPRVLELDGRQPEFIQTFWRYLGSSVNGARTSQGAAMLREHADLLVQIHARYGVQPRFIVALWGLETSYGEQTGGFPLIAALATLAWDSRRAEFFREQLLILLSLVQKGDVPIDARGSWAGAFGQMQFMPTTFAAYAVDYDGDGRIDLWNNLGDVFASSANYLSSIGWDSSATWGREVLLPPDFDYARSGLEYELTVDQWAALGVMSANSAPLPPSTIEASVLLPGGAFGAPAFLVYNNFRKIMNWNNSQLYAIAAGHLADRIIGGGDFVVSRPSQEEVMSRDQIVEMQSLLSLIGLDTGGADGRVGPKTRLAIKSYQSSISAPADGYPTLALLQQLRGNLQR